MTVRDLRIRYALETANHNRVIHGIVTDFNGLKHYLDRVREVGYELVGIDERFREDNDIVELNEGWKQVYPLEEKEKEHVYLCFR